VRLVVRYLPDAPKFTRLFVNEEYCRAFGVKSKDVVGASSLSLISKSHRAAVSRKLASVVKSGSIMLSTEIAVRPDGRKVKTRWLDVPVMDRQGSGKVVEIIAVGELINK
jgi:PAS domain S-box-containing protein